MTKGGEGVTASGQKTKFLTCERNWVYFTLTAVAGFWGAYTYLLRGNVFCNAQTGNVVLMAMALGSAKWAEALYYLIPLSAYILGAFVSELMPNPVKHHLPVRWDTLLIAIEILAIFLLGLLPESAPVQLAQVGINFIASMQYNTFRQAEGIPVATTAIGKSGATNAGLLAVSILSTTDEELAGKLQSYRDGLKEKVAESNAQLV